MRRCDPNRHRCRPYNCWLVSAMGSWRTQPEAAPDPAAVCIDLDEAGVLQNRPEVKPRGHTDLELGGDVRCRQIDSTVMICEVERADVGRQRPSTTNRWVMGQRLDPTACRAEVDIQPQRRRAAICPTSSRYGLNRNRLLRYGGSRRNCAHCV